VSGSNTNVRDVWYAFVATGSAHNIVVQSGENFDAVVEVYGSACSTATRIGTCTNAAGEGLPETVTLTTLTAGSTYYIRVYDYHENVHTSLPGGATFSICVHTPCSPQPVANFIASQTTGLCPFYVNFFDMSATTGAVSRLWTIYNGGSTPITTTTQNPTSILYNVFGAYLVKLTVTDACGSDTKYVSGYINVTGGPCAVGIEEPQLQPLLDVYPNPTAGSFVVSSSQPITDITVVNMVGQQVLCPMQLQNDGKVSEVSLAAQPFGVYILTIHTQAGMLKRKIVKE
jgi:PKD repeat protein